RRDRPHGPQASAILSKKLKGKAHYSTICMLMIKLQRLLTGFELTLSLTQILSPMSYSVRSSALNMDITQNFNSFSLKITAAVPLMLQSKI
ncbi:hypothetical protein J6590_101746, partial [Homalodisca vitripennis]